MYQKCIKSLSNYYWKLLGIFLLAISDLARAGNENPFPSVTVDGDIIKASGTKLQMGLKYATIGTGGILVLAGIGVILHRMREDAREKDHGNFLVTFIMVALCETVGFALIAIGWKAFNTSIT